MKTHKKTAIVLMCRSTAYYIDWAMTQKAVMLNKNVSEHGL